MADNKKISDLPDDSALTLADYVPIVSPGSSQTKKATLAHVMALAGGSVGGSGSGGTSVFLDSFVVNLPNNQTGVPNGTVVNAGDSVASFIETAFKQASAPTLALDTNGNIQPYNQTNISLAISIAYTINTSGASLANIKLERSRDNSTWTTLLNTATPTSTFSDTGLNPSINNAAIYYRLTVTDSAGGTNTATKQVSFAAYAAPSVSLSVGSTVRESGDISSTISGTITRNSPNVALTNYQLQYQVNGSGSWVNIDGPVSLSGSSQTFSVSHNNDALKTSQSISYKVVVTDAQQSTNSGVQTVNFIYRLWYDSVATVPSNSAGIRLLTNTQLTNASNTFTLATGTTNTHFVIALPPGKSLVSVFNIEANTAITSEFITSSITVNDLGGTAVNYTLYTKTTSIPYSPSNNLAITLA